MNKYLSLVLMAKLSGLEYISKAGGLVQTIQKVIPNGTDKPTIKKIPISAVHQAPENCDLTEAISVQFIPESKLKGMFYFEDNGSTTDTSKRHTGLNFWRSRMRLVVWMNQKLINTTYDIEMVAIAMNEMIYRLTREKFNSGVFKNIMVAVSSVASQTSDIFSAYDYNEAETQFLMPPYDFFALDLDITFGIPKNCNVPLIPVEGLPNCGNMTTIIIEYGYSDTNPFTDVPTEFQFQKTISSNLQVLELDFTQQASGKYVFFRFLHTNAKNFNHYFMDEDNYGDITPQDILFREKLIIGSYDYFMAKKRIYFSDGSTKIIFTNVQTG